MKKKLYSVIAAIFCVLAIFGLCACADENPPTTSTTTTSLRMVCPDGAPALALANMLGSTVTLADCEISTEIVAENLIATEMASESADLLIMPTNAGANLYLKGAKYKLVSTNVMGILYMIGSSSYGELTVASLAGKTIGCIGQGNTPDIVLQKIITHANLTVNDDSDPNTVTVNYYANGAAVKAALDASQCDLGVVGEPAATNFMAAYPNQLDMQEAWKTATSSQQSFPQASLFVKESVLTAHPELKAALLQKLTENLTYVADNASTISQTLASAGSATTIKADAIARCNLNVIAASDAKANVNAYLQIVIGQTMPNDFYAD